MAMNNMSESHKRGQTGVNILSQDVKARDLSGIACFLCHKKGHIQENLSFSNKAGASSLNKETPATYRYEPTTVWRYKRPKSVDPETKVVNNTTYIFCNKCVQ